MTPTLDAPRPIAVALLACAALVGDIGRPVPVAAQSIPIARTTGGSFEIWSAPVGGGAPAPVLADVVFRDLALAGSPLRERLRRDRPQLVDAAGVAPHIRLPGGGSLHLVRIGANDALLHVRADGSVALPLELAAGGPEPALQSTIGVSADGRFALLTTALAAGGDVYRVDLPAGTSTLLSAAAAPLDVAEASLRVCETRAWFVADGTLHRADIVAGGDAAPVALGLPADASVLAEVAASEDGTALAVVAQQADGLRRVLVVRPDGAVSLVTPTAGDYDTPGYDQPSGPHLALSPQGRRVAFRGTLLGKKELFTRDLLTSDPVEQLTADAFYVDTIDNVGVIGFVGTNVQYVAGELATTPGLVAGGADLFRASFTAGGTTLENLTLTSGLASPPFVEAGELEVLQAVVDPLGERLLLVVDPDGADAAVLAQPLGGGPTTVLLGALDAPPLLDAVASSVLVRSTVDVGGTGPGPTALHLLRPAGAPVAAQLLATVPVGITLDRFADDGDAAAACIASAGAGLELPVLLDLPSGALALAWFEPFAGVSAPAFTPDGRLAVGLGLPGGPYLYAAFDGPLAGSLLGVPVGGGFPLRR